MVKLDETHHHGQLMKMVAIGNNMACYKVPTGPPDYGNLSVEVAKEIKNLQWYWLECQIDKYHTHTHKFLGLSPMEHFIHMFKMEVLWELLWG
jgi:hypothetical protein